ncbi:MAG: amidohydrolase [Haloferacaceae archaeon]
MGESTSLRARASELRRTLHRYPEPSWCEFYTTSRIVDELEALGVDEIHVGSEVIDADDRMGVPDESELERWHEKAREAGAREDVLEKTAGGLTGAVAVLRQGDGPTVGLRVDIDALRREESTDERHLPAAKGFRSGNPGVMHACGHDAHTTMGLGVVEALRESDFEGTLKVFFQPAEEVLGGGKPMANSGLVDDVEFLLAVHVGLNHPTGEVVAGGDRALAVRQLNVAFTGESAHAGLAPNEGRNAMQAAGTAIQNLYGVPRHEAGLTRVNVGRLDAGSAPNVVADEAEMEMEVRGGTNDLLEYMGEEADRVLRAAAEMHDCELDVSLFSEAPRCDSDDGVVDVVEDVAGGSEAVESVVRRANLNVSEDATYLMQAVEDNGGEASYVVVGTDHPTGHHTARFDVDEETIDVGIDVLSESLRRLGE